MSKIFIFETSKQNIENGSTLSHTVKVSREFEFETTGLQVKIFFH